MEILLRSLIDHSFLCFDGNTDTWCQLPCTRISRRQTQFCVIQFFEKSIWKIHCPPTVLPWEAPSQCEGVAWQRDACGPVIMQYKAAVAVFWAVTAAVCLLLLSSRGGSSGLQLCHGAQSWAPGQGLWGILTCLPFNCSPHPVVPLKAWVTLSSLILLCIDIWGKCRYTYTFLLLIPWSVLLLEIASCWVGMLGHYLKTGHNDIKSSH